MRKQLLGSNRIGNNEEAVESVIAPARLFHAVGGPGWLQVHLGKERDISGTDKQCGSPWWLHPLQTSWWCRSHAKPCTEKGSIWCITILRVCLTSHGCCRPCSLSPWLQELSQSYPMKRGNLAHHLEAILPLTSLPALWWSRRHPPACTLLTCSNGRPRRWGQCMSRLLVKRPHCWRWDFSFLGCICPGLPASQWWGPACRTCLQMSYKRQNKQYHCQVRSPLCEPSLRTSWKNLVNCR